MDVNSSIRGIADIFAWSNEMTVIGEVKGTSGTQVGAMCQVLAEMNSIQKEENKWPIGKLSTVVLSIIGMAMVPRCMGLRTVALKRAVAM